MRYIYLITVLLWSQGVMAQKGMGIGSADVHNSAVLDLTSTNRGLGLPHATQANINANLNPGVGTANKPKNGLMMYNSSKKGGQIYNDGEWQNIGIPTGAIIMWSGSTTNIPKGWALCDNSNGTPDLRSRFIVGYDSRAAATPVNVTTGKQANYGAVDNTGGKNLHVLSSNEMPGHTHASGTLTTANITGGAHGHSWDNGSPTVNSGHQVGNGQRASTDRGGPPTNILSSSGTHSHGTVDVTGSTAEVGNAFAHENRPPYYVLAFLIKL